MHHALINQSGVMTNSILNAIYETMKGNWAPRYTGPCFSHPESSATAASRAVASTAADVDSQSIALSAASAGAGAPPMPPPLFQLLAF